MPACAAPGSKASASAGLHLTSIAMPSSVIAAVARACANSPRCTASAALPLPAYCTIRRGETVPGNSKDRRNCKRKLRHPHYLSALLHARCLRQDENLIIYPCSVCSHLHVGHSKMKKKPVVYATRGRGRRRGSSARSLACNIS